MKRKHLLIVIAVCFAIIACKADSSLGFQAPELRVVALSGTPTPGFSSPESGSPTVFGGSGFFGSSIFRSAVINASGQTAFESEVVGDLLVDSQVFSEGSGTLDHVGPSSGARIRLNTVGQTVYISNGSDVFSKKPGETLETIAQSGDQVPDADNGVVFATVFDLGLSDSGRITFRSAQRAEGDSAISLGIFSHEANVLTSVVQDGDPSPVGNVSNPQFSNIGSHSVNASGQIVFNAAFFNGSGIFTTGETETTPLALTFSDAEFPFNSFRGTPKINASGEAAFFATVSGGIRSLSGVFSTGSGELQQVAIEDAQAPGVEPGVVFAFDRPIFPEVLLNDAGQTAFITDLTGENVDRQSAVFRERAGVLELVARDGDQVPGADDGLVLSDLEISNLEFNAAGQVAFRAGLTDQVSSSFTAIFATNVGGQLIEIIRTGDLIDVSDDPLVEDLRTVSSLRFSEDAGVLSSGGRSSSSLNDAGQLVFVAQFADDSEAVLVSNLAVFETVLGDVSLNGVVDFSDIGPFISILSTSGFLDQADINQDGQVNLSDIGPFIELLALN